MWTPRQASQALETICIVKTYLKPLCFFSIKEKTEKNTTSQDSESSQIFLLQSISRIFLEKNYGIERCIQKPCDLDLMFVMDWMVPRWLQWVGRHLGVWRRIFVRRLSG